MPGRQFVGATGYRYGFNGKENDLETLGTGQGTQDYGERIYNPSLGKFLSVDPITSEYPYLTPYQFASNMPIVAIDIDGLEADVKFEYSKSNQFVGGEGMSKEDKETYQESFDNIVMAGNIAVHSEIFMSRIFAWGVSKLFGTAVKTETKVATEAATNGSTRTTANTTAKAEIQTAEKTAEKAATKTTQNSKTTASAKTSEKLSKVEKTKTTEKVGNYTKITEIKPGKGPGQSRAEYVKYKNADGKTIKMYKDSYDRANKFQHRKQKYP